MTFSINSFSVSHFQSFGYFGGSLSFESNDKNATSNRFFVSSRSKCLSKVLALVGANGAGKTTLLRALAFTLWFLRRSDCIAGPVDSELIDSALIPWATQSVIPISFDLEFELDGIDFKYNLIITRGRVARERLEKRSRVRYSAVFDRVSSRESDLYVANINKTGLPDFVLENLRGNKSVVSIMAAHKKDLALKLRSQNVNDNVLFPGWDYEGFGHFVKTSNFYFENPTILERATDVLNDYLGFGPLEIIFEEKRLDIPLRPEDRVDIGAYGPERKKCYVAEIKRKNGNAEIISSCYDRESGIKKMFFLLAEVLPVLENGGLVIFDRLDTGLHPLLIRPILDLFFSPIANPRNAQIIFTSYSAQVLNILHEHQIVLVEKYEDGESLAWRLSDMGRINSADNFYGKYMAGAYGAVPKV